MKNENIYNKLVRDKILDVIDESRKESSFHLANDKEYQEELIKKVNGNQTKVYKALGFTT